MEERTRRKKPPASDQDPVRHPIGTLVIVALYGLLFAVGWLLIYFGLFLPRGHVGG